MRITIKPRKILKFTPHTAGTSLPSTWIHTWKLKPGDSVSMTIDEQGSLIVTPILEDKQNEAAQS